MMNLLKTMEAEFDENQTPLERWENFEFLNGISEDRKETVANNFEKLAHFLLVTRFEVVGFPAIYRILRDDTNINDINISKLLTCIYNAYEKCNLKTKENPDLEFDFEAEMCAEASEQYLNKKGN